MPPDRDWETIYKTEPFKVFCKANGLVTEKGNYKTSAEAGIRYLRNDPKLIEDHTALSDCIIEAEILKAVLEFETKKEILFTRNEIISHPWKIVGKEELVQTVVQD